MSDINEIFFELIRVAIGTQNNLSQLPSQEEWKQIYDLAKKQSLVGICFAGLQRLGADADEGFERIGMSETQYLVWLGMSANIQRKNKLVDKQCAVLQAKISKDGYRSYIMKGQANALLYRVHENENFCADGPINHKAFIINLPLLRQSGDIDVYLEGGLERVLAYAKTFGEIEHVNELEMTVPVFKDTEVEFHYRPFIMRNPWKNKKLQEFFDGCAEANFANRVCLNENKDENGNLWIVAPTIGFNIVHQLAHIHLHLFTEGIGMRQLMDYYFVLKAWNEENEDQNGNENVLHIVHELGLDRFASALMWVIWHVFINENENHNEDVNQNENWMLWEPNEEDGRFLLNEVMVGGNFGKHNENQNDRKGKVGYSLWAVFVRNLRLRRFDSGDWFWGPVWRISHKLMNKRI